MTLPGALTISNITGDEVRFEPIPVDGASMMLMRLLPEPRDFPLTFDVREAMELLRETPAPLPTTPFDGETLDIVVVVWVGVLVGFSTSSDAFL